VAASGQILMTAHTQAEPVAERPLHATEDGHHRGSEERPAHKKRSRFSPTKRISLINNWICD
jgi:hypothetical protein